MKGIRKAFTFVPALLLGAVVGFGVSGCGSAGDDVTGPTDGTTTIAGADSAHASLGAYATSNPIAGGEFTIIATYRDASGVGAPGVLVTCEKEPPATIAGNTIFTFVSNPSMTGADGRVSISVLVHATTPTGSYSVHCYTNAAGNAATTNAYVGVEVGGAVTPTVVPTVTTLTLAGSGSPTIGVATNYIATATFTTGCNPLFQFRQDSTVNTWVPSPATTANGRSFTYTVAGAYFAQARALCTNADPADANAYVYSSPLPITASAPAATVTLATSTPAVLLNNTAFLTATISNFVCAGGADPTVQIRSEGATTLAYTAMVGTTGNQRTYTTAALSNPGTVSYQVRAFCPTTTDYKYSALVNVTVSTTPPAQITVTAPNVPAFAPAVIHVTVPELFSSNAPAPVCSNGDSVQYQFTATGNPAQGTPTPWAGPGAGSNQATFTWPALGAGNYQVTVTVQARCFNSPSVVSAVTSLSVTVLDP